MQVLANSAPVVTRHGHHAGDVEAILMNQAFDAYSASRSECEWDHKCSGQQKEVKRASDKMRFHRGANVRFHLACASVRKRLLLRVPQRCRDN